MDQDLFQQTKSQIIDLLNNNLYYEADILAEQGYKVFNDFHMKKLLGLCKFSIKKYDECKKILYEIVSEHPNGEDFNNLSLAERFTNNINQSYKLGLKAVMINPKNPAFWANLSTTAKILGKHNKSIEFINKALELQPNNTSFYFNKGSYYFHSGHFRNAEKTFKTGLKIKPINENMCVELFYILASQKRYEEAWKFYEFRYNTMKQVSSIYKRSKLPVLLEKKSYYDEKIAIFYEQGNGDNLMFLRFVPEFQKVAPNSYLINDHELLSGFVNTLNIRQSKQILSDTTHMICIMSLPYHLSIKKILQPLLIQQHKPKPSKKLKVGIVWAGSAYHPMDLQRSAFLSDFEIFLNDDSMEIYSFMKDRRKRKRLGCDQEIDFSENFDNYKIIDLGANLKTVQDTADQLNNIDIVISVDTFAAHIAGSCNVPTFLIVSDLPDWRWGRRSEKSDWYKSVRIFRKNKKCTYKDVIRKIYNTVRQEFKLD